MPTDTHRMDIREMVPKDPPKSRRHPGSVADRVANAMTAAGDWVRPVEIAETLDLPTNTVVNAMRSLVLSGFAERQRSATGPRNGPGSSVYRAISAG